MTTRDPYDPAVVFDDLTDDDAVVLGTAVPFIDRVAGWIGNAKRRLQTRLRGEDVRLDDQPSYLAFRVARLEQALRQHVADGHGSPVTVMGAAIPLPCCSGGAIDCWQDGDDICCTVRFMGPDGPRAATATVPAEPITDAVVGAAWDSDIEYNEAVVLGGPISAFVGADRLVSEICGCIAGYLDDPKKSGVRDRSVAANQYLHGCDVIIACHGGA